MTKKVLITGIQGFLGNRLKDILCNKYEIFGLARIEHLDGDTVIYSSSKLSEINIKPDYVIICHAAVSSGNLKQINDDLYNINVRLTEDVIKTFNDSKIIYISTASIFLNTGSIITEHTASSPINSYSISKYWAEQVILSNSEAVILRLSSLYGIGMKDNTIIPNYVNQALQNKTIEVWGEGSRKQNYTHVNDVCFYIEKCIRHFDKVKNKTLLPVHCKEYSNKELAVLISKYTDAVITYVNTDNALSYHYDNKITQQLLNWSPISNFEQEINNYIQWKQKQF